MVSIFIYFQKKPIFTIFHIILSLEELLENEAFLKAKELNNGVFDGFFQEKGYKYYGNWKNSKPNGLGMAVSQGFLEIGNFKVYLYIM